MITKLIPLLTFMGYWKIIYCFAGRTTVKEELKSEIVYYLVVLATSEITLKQAATTIEDKLLVKEESMQKMTQLLDTQP